MISSALKKFALEKGMTVSHGAAYGELDGYMVTLREGMDVKTASFAVSFPDDASREQVLHALTDPQRVRQFRLANPVVTPESISVNFIESSRMMDKIRSFLSWFPAVLEENGAVGVGSCPHCREPLAKEEPSSFVLADGTAMRLHPNCAGALNVSPQQDTPKKHIGRGLIGAVVGMLIGMIPWVLLVGYNGIIGGAAGEIISFFAKFSGIFGFVIALLAKKGYELLGGKPSKAKFPILLTLSIVGALFAQLLGQGLSLYLLFDYNNIAIDPAQLPISLFYLYRDGLILLQDGGENFVHGWNLLVIPIINVLGGIGLAALWISKTPKEARVAADSRSMQGILLLDGEPLPTAEGSSSTEEKPDVPAEEDGSFEE